MTFGRLRAPRPFGFAGGPPFAIPSQEDLSVSQNLAEARYELAVANRILGHEGVLDAFGHVSMRHPADPGKYLLPRSRSPELIEPDDIFEFTLDSAPIVPPKVQLY